MEMGGKTCRKKGTSWGVNEGREEGSREKRKEDEEKLKSAQGKSGNICEGKKDGRGRSHDRGLKKVN